MFKEKGVFDPLREPDQVFAREDQERRLVRTLQGVNEGYLPSTVAHYSPPVTGKTVIVRRVCGEFAKRTPGFDFEYVNLEECRTLFSGTNEILLELNGERK